MSRPILSDEQIARGRLERELIGPGRGPGPQRTGSAQRDRALLQEGPKDGHDHLLPRHVGFRSALDRLVRTFGSAADRGEQARLRKLDTWDMLVANVAPSASGTIEPQTSELAEALHQQTKLKDAIEDIVCRQVQALGNLPWARDWILSLARQQSQMRAYTFLEFGLLLSGLTPGRLVCLTDVDLSDVGLRRIQIPRDESKERLRIALQEEAKRRLPSRPADQELLSLVRERIELSLAESHPPGSRPYTTDRTEQISRDVGIWVRVRIEHQATADIAADASHRFGEEPGFRFRPGGRRSFVPTSSRGVRGAVRRADRLLYGERRLAE